jgi:hypothetical protein
MKLKKVWNALKEIVVFIEVFKLVKEILFPSGIVTVIFIGGGKMLSPVDVWLRTFISTHWYLFYIFTIFSLSVFAFSIKFIIKTHNEVKQKKKQELLKERERIGDRILIVPRTEIFYHNIYLHIINLSPLLDIKISSIELTIDSINFKDSFLNADEKIIKSLSSRQVQVKPTNIMLPKSLTLNPDQIIEKKINGIMFFSIESEEFSISICSNLIWRDINAKT